MNPRPSRGGYLRFLVWTVGMAAGIALVGWLPTARWGGPNAVRAMIAGCAVGVIASALGGIPVLVFGANGAGGTGGAVGIVASMAVRFTVALGLALAAALSGLFARGPLLIWVALSYLVLLVTDTRFALVSSTSEQEK